jgi:hypothetical protein
MRRVVNKEKDNMLHTHVSSFTGKLYRNVLIPSGASPLDDYTLATFEPASFCRSDITESLNRVGTNGTIPCSLNSTGTSIWTLANNVQAFSTLGEGITGQSDGFILSRDDYQAYLNQIDQGAGTDIQIVTHLDPNTNLTHALLFNMTAATSFSNFANGTDYTSSNDSVAYWGVDFAASTFSMVTNCVSATQACNIHSNSNASAGDLAIPFRCSSLFAGDVWQSPSDGVEQFKGWHTWFYDNSTGVINDTFLSSQLNPFYFNATAALTSIDYSVLVDVDDPQVADGAVVNAGNGRVALALTCEATIYNVNFSLVDGYFSYFNATIADPRIASIIKAPLQYGFGRYAFYQQAQLGILLNDNITVAESMGLSFSQIGMALVSGAFDITYATQQRERWYAIITVVPGFELWFLVVVCLLYAAFGIGVAIAAFALRRDHDIALRQAGLVPTTRLPIYETVKDLVVAGLGKAKDLEEKIEGKGK